MGQKKDSNLVSTPETELMANEHQILSKARLWLGMASAIGFLAFNSSLAQAQDQTIGGNLIITGTLDAFGEADIRGNVLTLGSLAGTGTSSLPGVSLTFTDSTNNLSLLRFTSSRPLQEWLFEHPAVTGTNVITAMKLDSQHRLTLSDTNNTARIVLDPATGQITLNGQTLQSQFVPFSYLSGGGNVGIGTSNPLVKLHVLSGSPGSMGFPYESSSFEAESDNKVGIYNSMSDPVNARGASLTLGYTNFTNTNGNYPGFEIQNNLYNSGSELSDNVLRFNSLERDSGGNVVAAKTNILALTGNGNVGIGTTSPQAQLHVAGKGRFDDTVHIEERGDLSMGEFTYDPDAEQQEQEQSQQTMSRGFQAGGAAVMSSGSDASITGTTSRNVNLGRPVLSATTSLGQ